MINDKNESYIKWNQTKEIIEYDSFLCIYKYMYKIRAALIINNYLCKTIKQIDGWFDNR